MFNTLFFFPDSLIKEKYFSNKSIFFFDESGFSFFKNGSRIVSKLSIYDFDELSLSITPAIIHKLRFWGPLYSRMLAKGDQHEMLLRRIALIIEQVTYLLKSHQIKKVVLGTGITHHIDTLVFDYACTQLKIEKIFLYTETIQSRLIPFVQNAELPSRRVLRKKISDFDYKLSIKRYIDNKRNGNSPISNHPTPYLHYMNLGDTSPTSDFKDESMWDNFYPLAFVNAVYLDFKFILRDLKRCVFDKYRKQRNIFDFIYQTYPFSFSMQLFQTYKALRFYKKNTISSQRFKSLFIDKGNKALIIAAHMQPEASSFPEGWKYGDHIDIVIALRNKGYRDKIYYKEHFGTFNYRADGALKTTGIARSEDYYKQLLALGCIFLDDDFKFSINSKECNWYLPLTITGNIALERSLFGLSTIVCGFPWYDGLPGTIKFDSIKSFESIPKNATKESKKLSFDAFSFIDQKLSFNTIVNNSGIGGLDKVVYDKQVTDVYLREIDSLIN